MTPDSENADHSNIPKQTELKIKTCVQEDCGILIVSEAKSHQMPSIREIFSMSNSVSPQLPVAPLGISIPSSQTSINTFRELPLSFETINSNNWFHFDSIKTKLDNKHHFSFDTPIQRNLLQTENKTEGPFKWTPLLETSINNIPERPNISEHVESSIPPEHKMSFSFSKKTHIERPLKKDSKISKCTCKKSFCLRLYCDCFAKGQLCGSECACSGCHNNPQFEEIREVMVKETKEKNPLAFSSKYKRLSGDQQILHSRGCNCSKTGCVKKYCECFNAGTGCSRLCRCTNCRNENIELKDNEIKVYYEKVLRKRRKHSAFIQYLDSKFESNKKDKEE